MSFGIELAISYKRHSNGESESLIDADRTRDYPHHGHEQHLMAISGFILFTT